MAMIQSVARAGQILLALGDDRRLGVTDLARRLGLTKPTVHGLLRTLAADGLVEQDPDTGKYQLGLTVFRLGSTVLANHALRGRSLRWADALSTRTGQPAQVGVLDGGHVLVVHQTGRPGEAGPLLEVGTAIRWHACALGRAIVAHLPAADRHGLDGALARIAAAGIAVDEQPADLGEAALAAPVFAAPGQIAGALGITGPAHRLVPDGPRPELLAAVRDCARGLSRDLANDPR
jgi:DNA-binding IclR family transcriptional regulator